MSSQHKYEAPDGAPSIPRYLSKDIQAAIIEVGRAARRVGGIADEIARLMPVQQPGDAGFTPHAVAASTAARLRADYAVLRGAFGDPS